MRILLQRSDVPAGSEATPHGSPGGKDVTIQAEKARCVGVRNTQAEMDSNAHSDDFAFPGGSVIVVSSAISYPSQSSVDQYVAMVTSPKFSRCYEQAMRSGAGPESAFEDSSVKITAGSGGGPSNVVATGASTVRMSGQSKPVFLSLAFISGPLMTAEVVANGMNGTPVPASQMQALVRTVATRAAKG